MADSTRLVDLPDTTHESMPMNGYMPINVHPNPYGGSGVGGMSPPPHPPMAAPPSPEHYPMQRLPSRDIPQIPQQYTHDPTIKANYIPDEEHAQRDDYLRDLDEQEERLKHAKKAQESHTTRKWIDRLQWPLIVALLYFIFQTAIVRRLLFRYVNPLLGIFNKDDGCLNIQGMVFKSGLFAAALYAVEHAPDWV